jgi:predicted amidohydrolase/DNA-binding beta-propeller fold protein YncE
MSLCSSAACRTTELRATFNRFYEEAVWCVAFAPDGKTVAAVSVKGTTKVLDARTAQEIAGRGSGGSDSHAPDTYGLAVAPDGQTLAISHYLQKRTKVQKNGKRELRVDYSGEVRLWDMKTGQARATLKAEPGHGVSRVAYKPDGTTLAVLEFWKSGGSEQTNGARIALWDVSSGKLRSTLPLSGNLAFSPDGKTLAVGSSPVQIVDAVTGKELAKLPVDKKSSPTCIAFGPDGRTLAGADFNGRIYVWDVPGRALRATRTVAGIVLKWVRGDKEANYRRLEPLIRAAAKNRAQVIVTTECCLDGYAIADKSIPLEDYRALGESIPEGTYYRRLAKLAGELNVFLVVGILEADGEARYNAAVLIGPDGELVGKYRKQNLGHESGRNTPGTASLVHETPFGKVGLMICADRTDPAIVRRFCENRAGFLLCPSGGMFGPKSNDPIVQARSRENGLTIIFVHPAEFLVTGPDGSIRDRHLLGDTLTVSKEQIDGPQDRRRICYYDVPLTTSQ